MLWCGRGRIDSHDIGHLIIYYPLLAPHICTHTLHTHTLTAHTHMHSRTLHTHTHILHSHVLTITHYTLTHCTYSHSHTGIGGPSNAQGQRGSWRRGVADRPVLCPLPASLEQQTVLEVRTVDTACTPCHVCECYECVGGE